MLAAPTIILHGNLTADPATKEVNGKSIVEFTVAVNSRKDDPPTFYRCSTFNPKAIPTFIKKGSPVSVTGEYKPREYQKDGQTRVSHDVYADRLVALPSPKSEAKSAPSGGATDDPQF